MDDSDNVYAADECGCRIQKFTNAGTYLTQWGGQGAGDGEFEWPSGIAADHQGHVYVVDVANGRIQKFTTVGKHLSTWAIPGTRLAAAPDSGLYVVDEFGAQVVELDGSGVELRRWGSSGHGDGQFMDPIAVAVSRAGDVFVADADDGRIQRFGMATRWLITGAAGPDGSIRPAGDVYVAEGMNQSYSIVPNLGYRVSGVLVDGNPVGTLAAYTFTNVTADHTIDAGFTVLEGWPNDALLNLPVCIGVESHREPQIVSDGANGAFLAWSELLDKGGATTFGVRVQHIDARGVPQWPGCGNAVCVPAALGRFLRRIVPDGEGGTIVLWSEYTSTDHCNLHAQRFDATGTARWPGAACRSAPT